MGIQFEQSEVGNDGGRGGAAANKQEDAEILQHGTASASEDSPSANSRSKADLSKNIGKWLRDVEKFGFINNNVDANREDEEGKKLHAGYFKRKLPTFCICDPFSGLNIQDTDSDLRVEFVNDLENSSGIVKPEDTLVGEMTLAVTRRSSRYILGGKWRKGLREGRGSVSGPGLEANFGVSDIVGRYRRGRLEGWAKVYLADSGEIWGHFVDGALSGVARGLDREGRLSLACYFRDGTPAGPCWKKVHGGGCLYGHLDDLGRFTGDDIAYLYPDLITCIRGRFHESVLVEGKECSVVASSPPSPAEVLALDFSEPRPRCPLFRHWPSTLSDVTCPPFQEDPYEKGRVEVRGSEIGGAGDGLFATRDLAAGETVAFYNGIRVSPGQTPPFKTFSYEIFVEWVMQQESDYMDIPPHYVNVENYRATLAHKINHSFTPNCGWDTIEHPVFGKIPSVVALADVERGQELTCHYRYDMRDALKIPELQWYVDQWDRLTEGVFEARKCGENGDFCVDRNRADAAPDPLPGGRLTEEDFINEIIDGVIEKVINSGPIQKETES